MRHTIKAEAFGSTTSTTVVAKISTNGLTADESKLVKRVLSDRLQKALSDLPYSGILPFEVRVS